MVSTIMLYVLIWYRPIIAIQGYHHQVYKIKPAYLQSGEEIFPQVLLNGIIVAGIHFTFRL